MHQISLRSPSKLNLFLKVINKRPDGYHNLETLFERIDLCDDIHLKTNKTGAIRIFCDHPQVPKGPKNLVYKVAKILQEDFKVDKGIDITIAKRIPVAAGLAGGSSNAATVLLGLTKTWGLPLKQKELLRYARMVGSDVAFFLYDCSWAVGTNRGDRIKVLPLSTRLWHLLIVPCVKMYSREVFGRLNLQLTKNNGNVNILIHYLKENSLYKRHDFPVNDLESSILEINPALSNVMRRLSNITSKQATFSGSGPALFALMGSKQEAENAKLVLNRYYRQVYVVRTF